MEATVNKAFPTGGKGVTKEVRQQHYQERERVLNEMSSLFSEKVQAPTFGIFGKEAK